MSPRDALLALAVAVAAGALIGAEREQAHGDRPHEDFGGVRTFPLIALLGALGALLGGHESGLLLVALLGAVVVFLVVSRMREKSDDPGVTSEVAAVVTFALGALAGSSDFMPSTPRLLFVLGLAAVTMTLLALKRPLHGFIARVSQDDVYATAKFALLASVLLPLLPNRTFGPLDVLNPFKVGVFVVLVACVSFAGYVAVRLLGSDRGLLLVGLVGGLVSSTAVTVTLSRRAKEEAALAPTCALAILAAWSAMFLRVLAIVGIVDTPLVGALAWPLGAMAVSGFVVALVMARAKDEKRGRELLFRNPFELKSALGFGLFFALIALVAKASESALGATGVYASSVVAGLADVDAITLSLTELHRAGTSRAVVATGIVLAVVTNTLVKSSVALVVGGRALGTRVAVASGAVLLGGGAGLLVQWLAAGE